MLDDVAGASGIGMQPLQECANQTERCWPGPEGGDPLQILAYSTTRPLGLPVRRHSLKDHAAGPVNAHT